jgi:hypothetical protein
MSTISIRRKRKKVRKNIIIKWSLPSIKLGDKVKTLKKTRK